MVPVVDVGPGDLSPSPLAYTLCFSVLSESVAQF